MSNDDNKRRQKLGEIAKICMSIPGPKGDGFASSVFSSVADLYNSIDNEKLHVPVTANRLALKLSIQLDGPDCADVAKALSNLNRIALNSNDHDRQQVISYLQRGETMNYRPQRQSPYIWPIRVPTQYYRLRWNGKDSFDLVRIK